MFLIQTSWFDAFMIVAGQIHDLMMDKTLGLRVLLAAASMF